MAIFRFLGYLLLIFALVTGGMELVRSLIDGYWNVLGLGELIAQWDRLILQNIQVGLERYVHPVLWDPIMLELLVQPAWIVAGLPGVLLVLLLRRRAEAPSDWD